ncbi:MAG: hypothetical protein Q9220_005482 [cf. Caloplaca sp. 1 TL-2023]
MANTSKATLHVSVHEKPQDDATALPPPDKLQSIPWWKFGGRDQAFVSTRSENSRSSLEISNDARDVEDEVAADDSIVLKPLEKYEPNEKYEGRHRFDPEARWSEAEEKKLVRRVDIKILVWVCVMSFALSLDRGNIVQALSDNMLDDVGMNRDHYSKGVMMFFLAFLVAELPSQLISKKFGPENWIPTVACLQSLINGKTAFYIVRFLLGLLEGEPSWTSALMQTSQQMILYLSYFYKNSELPLRFACFGIAAVGTNIVGSFLAFGILHLRGHGGWAGWRYLFAIEGGMTAVIGIITWLYLPPSPTQTKRYGLKGLLRPKAGWFSEREEIILVTRILRDDPSKASMHNRQGVGFKLLWESFCDYDLWPIYLIALSWTVPMVPTMINLTLSLRSFGFSTFQTNLLTIPSTILFILQILFWTWFSEKYNQRLFVGLACQIWVIPLLIAQIALPAEFSGANWVRFALSSLICAFPDAHPVFVSMTSRNSGSVRTRAVGASVYIIVIQISHIISTQVYRKDDAPLYRVGNKVLLGIAAFNIVLFICAKSYYVWKNRLVPWNLQSPWL